MSQSIIEKADNYVFNLFKNANSDCLLYHNYKHSYNVVEACKEIALASNISDDELEIIQLAAWFHDVGYLKMCEGHEEESVSEIEKFLAQENYPQNQKEQIYACIRATKLEVEPSNLLEEIMCDADMKGLSSKSYEERAVLLKTEFAKIKNLDLTEQEWLEKEIEFLTQHKYHTKYAQLNYNEGKAKNLVSRQNELAKFSKKKSEQDEKTKLKQKEISLKTKRSEIPEKGIETMFRTALKNHMELSAIADNKANIMLSINALVLSIIIANLFSKLDSNPTLILPTVSLLLVCLVSIIMATLSTKPKITSGKFSTEDVKNRKSNLLFFGNFHKMSIEDYEWGMKEIMKDRDYLYGSLTRDLYSLGVVLAKKYKYLRLCYTIFMYGMVLSVILFGVSIMFVEK